jgi:hypothetical protein
MLYTVSQGIKQSFSFLAPIRLKSNQPTVCKTCAKGKVTSKVASKLYINYTLSVPALPAKTSNELNPAWISSASLQVLPERENGIYMLSPLAWTEELVSKPKSEFE